MVRTLPTRKAEGVITATVARIRKLNSVRFDSIIFLILVGILFVHSTMSVNQVKADFIATIKGRVVAYGQNLSNVPASNASASTAAKHHDASIIITSNLIPTHPSIDMISDTIRSLSTYLVGLPTDTPIFVTVDGLPKETNDTSRRRQQYIQNMQEANFAPLTNIKVLPMDTHLHLAGSINHTLATHVKTDFVYIVQHDFPFCNFVNHTNLIKAMKENSNTLYNVRFRKRPAVLNNCPIFANNQTTLQSNGLDFFATTQWSDNNHIANAQYYQKMLDRLGMLKRPMEGPMQYDANLDCIHSGQQIYGAASGTARTRHICHADGRTSMSYSAARSTSKS